MKNALKEQLCEVDLYKGLIDRGRGQEASLYRVSGMGRTRAQTAMNGQRVDR